MPTIMFTGSPTKRNSVNAISATVSITMTACNRRRIMKASIRACLSGYSRHRTRARKDFAIGGSVEPRALSPSPGGGGSTRTQWASGWGELRKVHPTPGVAFRFASCSPTLPLQGRVRPALRRSPGLFLPEPIEQDLVVSALHDLHLLRRSPSERLLVQRHVAPILLLPELVGGLDELVALAGVGLDEDLLDHVLHLRIAVVSDVVVTAAALLVAAAIHVGEHVPAVERAGRPAEQVKRAVVSARH